MSDPFPGRCRHCGLCLMDDTDDCGRGDACKSSLDHIRAAAAGVCSAVLRGARRIGLLK